MDLSWTNLLERRKLMRNASMGAVATAFMMKTTGASAAQAASNIDPDILNFALQLEYLEGEFYSRAVFGTGLMQAGVPLSGSGNGSGTQGTVSGGSKVAFQSRQSYQLALEIAEDERAHVLLLRNALATAGYTVTAEPTIDLSTSFTNAAIAAGLISAGQTFNPFANENDFLLGAFIFEDVGVSAYGGAAPLITSKTYLQVAAQILAVEAYHAGSIRTRLYQGGFGAQTDKIAALRAKASGTGPGTNVAADDHGVLTNSGQAAFVDADANALAYVRTTSQVLNVVYLGQSSTAGGFFPNGVNGAIHSSAG